MKKKSIAHSTEFSVFNFLTDGFYAIDENLVYLYVNDKGAKLAQKSPEEMIGKKITDLFPDAHKLAFGKTVLLVLKKGKPHVVEAQYPTYNKWYETSVFPIPQGVGIIAKDITEKKQLEENQLRMTAIISSSDDAIISKNLTSIITSWNYGAEKMFGYTANEIVGKSIRILIPEELQKEEDEILAQLRQGKRIEHFETKRITKKGKVIDVSLTISPLQLPTGEIIGASKIARDITEKKLMEKQKDNFISIASHELKTPLTSMKAFIQVLQRRIRGGDDIKNIYLIDKIDGQIAKLQRLIDDLLDIRKTQLGKLDLNPKHLLLDEIVKDIVETFRYSFESHQIILKGSTNCTVLADKERIEQVLTNLITNAIKYSPDANKVIVHLEHTRREVIISVQDFGIGIAKEELEKIFQPFYRSQNNTQISGLGLGLYISENIIKRHGGKITITSKKNNGSIFTVLLPVKK